MTSRVQVFRTPTTGVAPAAGTRQSGELWLNFADFQLGMIDASRNAQKLVAVRYFQTTANYVVGEFVIQAGALYVANTAVTAGAFSAPQWTKIATSADITAAIAGIAVPGPSSTTPAMDGTATIGTGTTYARADHVHPSDTSRAPLASPAFTGTPSLPTGATGVTQTAGDSSTKLATTAFVGAAAAALPVAMNDNRIINGNFAVNQRGQVSGTALAAAAYGHDRWKAGAGGGTYTFTAASPDTTITITAGSLLQIIEGGNIEGGVYILSWTGTAKARVYQGTATGTYVASPLITAALTAGADTTVDFNAGTLTKVKFENGTAATPFNRQSLAKSMADCQRYYCDLANGSSSPAYQVGGYFGAVAAYTGPLIYLPVPMRALPTATLRNFTAGGILGFTLSTMSTQTITSTATNNGTGNQYATFNLMVNAEL